MGAELPCAELFIFAGKPAFTSYYPIEGNVELRYRAQRRPPVVKAAPSAVVEVYQLVLNN